MTEKNIYQICTRCVMDTSAKDINFDVNGVCNYCTEFIERSGHIINQEAAQYLDQLNALVTKIKFDGKSKSYDCIIGVSGGVDSSWVLVKAIELGLRPLAVHMDNGWNSELAQSNIANLVNELGVDLYTHVIDWAEYKRLMQAFFDADVIDIELLYDNAMLAVNYQQAAKFGVKYILSGSNQATEGMRIPKEWTWFKFDKRNIYSLARLFGGAKIKTFPSLGTIGYVYYEFIRGIKWVSFLDNLPYNKQDVLKILETKYHYKPYPYKHYESIFTRFYQGYILPRKFNVDKRRVHFATLVAAGQMTRDDALEGIKGIPYPSEQAQVDDVQYFLKKMQWTNDKLQDYIDRPEVQHSAYPSERKLWVFIRDIYSKWIAK